VADECRLETQQYLPRANPELDALISVSQVPGEVCFPVQFERHIGAPLPHVEQRRFAANLLSLSARTHSINADTQELEQELHEIVDPFTGEPLHLRLEGSNVVLYSVGKDLADDGGTEENARFEPDIVAVAKSSAQSF
jgi:hypothetical protein